jgi:hypothetical protein
MPDNEIMPAPQTGRAIKEVEKDPFRAFAGRIVQTSIIGQLLKYSKGEWLAGKEAEEVPLGTKLVVNPFSLLTGWIKWVDNRPDQQVMGSVADFYQPPTRAELGDLDESTWEIDNRGDPRDPWQKASYMLLKKPGVRYAKETAFTFSTSSDGGMRMLADLCNSYADHRVEHDEEFPIVSLGTESYKHDDYGKIHKPQMAIVGWEDRKLFDAVAAVVGKETTEEAVKPHRGRPRKVA